MHDDYIEEVIETAADVAVYTYLDQCKAGNVAVRDLGVTTVNNAAGSAFARHFPEYTVERDAYFHHVYGGAFRARFFDQLLDLSGILPA